MDAFFVAVELRRRPELRGQPVVVGGTGRRGVVAAASYEARRYGVHSAMPTATARRLCPAAVFLPGDHATYAAVSREVHAHLRTPSRRSVEPLALDEAFLDVTGARALLGDGVTIARRLRAGDPRRPRPDLLGRRRRRTSSSPSWPRSTPSRGRRPTACGPGPACSRSARASELAYLHPLPVGRLWGVGPATLDAAAADGRRRPSATSPRSTRRPSIGALGRAHGRTSSTSPTAATTGRSSPSGRSSRSATRRRSPTTSTTSPTCAARSSGSPTPSPAGCAPTGLGARTLTLKVRDGGFATITRATTLAGAVDTAEAIVRGRRAAARRTIDLDRRRPPARRLGVASSRAPAEQLRFDDARPAVTRRRRGRPPAAGGTTPAGPSTASASASATPRSGRRAAWRSAPTGRGRVRVVRTGAQQWGPDHDGGAVADDDLPN